MSALILGVFALILWAASLTLPVSPDKLALEVGGLGLLATAAYTAYCFGVRGFLERGVARDAEERDHLLQVVVVFGFTAVCVFIAAGIAGSMRLTGKPSTPGSKTEPNAMHAVVIAFTVYFAVLLLAMLRWAKEGTARARKIAATIIVVCTVLMIGRTLQLAPRLPEFDLGENPA